MLVFLGTLQQPERQGDEGKSRRAADAAPDALHDVLAKMSDQCMRKTLVNAKANLHSVMSVWNIEGGSHIKSSTARKGKGVRYKAASRCNLSG